MRISFRIGLAVCCVMPAVSAFGQYTIGTVLDDKQNHWIIVALNRMKGDGLMEYWAGTFTSGGQIVDSYELALYAHSAIDALREKSNDTLRGELGWQIHALGRRVDALDGGNKNGSSRDDALALDKAHARFESYLLDIRDLRKIVDHFSADVAQTGVDPKKLKTELAAFDRRFNGWKLPSGD